MNALRLSMVTAVVAIVASPIAASATPSDVAAACNAPPRALVERRIEENAARGMPALVGFVHRTQPFYQVTVEEAVAWVDSERERRTACMRASAAKTAD